MKISLAQIKEAEKIQQENALIPEGEYIATITKVEEGETKSKTPFHAVELAVTVGNKKRCGTHRLYWSEKAQFVSIAWVKDVFQASGVEITNAISTDELAGKTFPVKVTIKEQQGDYPARNEFKPIKVKKEASVASIAAPKITEAVLVIEAEELNFEEDE